MITHGCEQTVEDATGKEKGILFFTYKTSLFYYCQMKKIREVEVNLKKETVCDFVGIQNKS
jgi:hypothetical protein